MRSEVAKRPALEECLTTCWHCGIIFLTDPRNAGREDLGCPFGCREEHRRRESSRRSTAYYQGEIGRVKKRIQNEKRSPQVTIPPTTPAAAEQPTPEVCKLCSPGMMAYLQIVISLIEGRRVAREEIVEMLRRTLRQHSIARERKIEHIVAWLKESFP